MIIISCLGNPGAQYRRNRHNIGFIIGSYLSTHWKIPVSKNSFSSLYGTGTIESRDICIILPQTYMNNSGQSVKKALDYFRTDPSSLIVIHDEIELDFGVYKTKFGGGHKGQNGIRSIIEHLGTPDFHRLRFGVGRSPVPQVSVADYVLSDFSEIELEQVQLMLPEIANTIQTLFRSIE